VDALSDLMTINDHASALAHLFADEQMCEFDAVIVASAPDVSPSPPPYNPRSCSLGWSLVPHIATTKLFVEYTLSIAQIPQRRLILPPPIPICICLSGNCSPDIVMRRGRAIGAEVQCQIYTGTGGRQRQYRFKSPGQARPLPRCGVERGEEQEYPRYVWFMSPPRPTLTD